MEDSVEIVIEKLLHVTKDIVPKVILYWWKDFILSALAFFPMSYSSHSMFRFQMKGSIA